MELIKNDLNQNNDEKFTKIQEIPGGGKSITFMIPNKKIKSKFLFKKKVFFVNCIFLRLLSLFLNKRSL